MAETSETLSSVLHKRRGSDENPFLVSAERVQQVKEIADTLKFRDRIGKQVAFLLLFEASKDKQLKTAFEPIGLTNGVVARWLSGDSLRDKDIVFDESVRSLRGEVPHRYWRERPAYKHRLEELGLQDFPAFPVTVPPTGRFNNEDINRIQNAYKYVMHSPTKHKDGPESKLYSTGGSITKKQALYLLLLEDQPDKSARRVAETLGSSIMCEITSKTIYHWKKDPDFQQSLNGLCGLPNGIDWRSIPEYRNALHDLGVSDLLDKEVQADSSWKDRIQGSGGTRSARLR